MICEICFDKNYLLSIIVNLSSPRNAATNLILAISEYYIWFHKTWFNRQGYLTHLEQEMNRKIHGIFQWCFVFSYFIRFWIGFLSDVRLLPWVCYFSKMNSKPSSFYKSNCKLSVMLDLLMHAPWIRLFHVVYEWQNKKSEAQSFRMPYRIRAFRA